MLSTRRRARADWAGTPRRSTQPTLALGRDVSRRPPKYPGRHAAAESCRWSVPGGDSAPRRHEHGCPGKVRGPGATAGGFPCGRPTRRSDRALRSAPARTRNAPQCHENLEAISSRRARLCVEQAFDLLQRFRVISLGLDGTHLHHATSCIACSRHGSNGRSGFSGLGAPARCARRERLPPAADLRDTDVER
jgi:hypothetical protein